MTTSEISNQRERLKPPSREVSDFFFDQRLYDFTNKNLPTYLTDDMKKHMEEHPDAKEKVGAILLAFEYFNSISEIKLDYNKDEFLINEKSWIQNLKNKTYFIGLTFLGILIVTALVVNFGAILRYFESF